MKSPAWTNQDKALLKKYESISSTKEEKEIYTRLQAELVNYRAIRANLDQYLLGNYYAEAVNLVPSFSKAREVVDSSIQELVDANQKVAAAAINKSENDFKTATIIMFIVAAASLLLALVFGNFFSIMLARPINILVQEAEKLAQGDVDVDVKTTSRDELGNLTTAFGKMADNIKRQAEAACRIASGDLSIEIVPNSEKDLLGNSMVTVVDTLNSLVREAELLTEAAVEGNLDTRGDAENSKAVIMRS